MHDPLLGNIITLDATNLAETTTPTSAEDCVNAKNNAAARDVDNAAADNDISCTKNNNNSALASLVAQLQTASEGDAEIAAGEDDLVVAMEAEEESSVGTSNKGIQRLTG